MVGNVIGPNLRISDEIVPFGPEDLQKMIDTFNWLDFMEAVAFNEMNQFHNCIQKGKLGWKEGAD